MAKLTATPARKSQRERRTLLGIDASLLLLLGDIRSPNTPENVGTIWIACHVGGIQ
jgi:hypothetical protein